MSCMCNADCIITIVFTNIIYDAENPAIRLFLGSLCMNSLRVLVGCIQPKVSFPFLISVESISRNPGRNFSQF